MFNLSDKVAIVTGGANGIGAEIVKEFLNEGVKYVAILDINDEAGKGLEKELAIKYGEGKVKFFNCDVTKDEQLFGIFDEVMKEFGGIDVVVNNAGIARDTLELYKKEIEINFTATVSSTLKAVELMRVDKGGKGGTVINISSVAGIMQLSPSVFVYGATKSAVLHFSTCVGKEAYYRHTNVRVITMCFGLTDTEIVTNMNSFDDIVNEGIKQLVGLHHQQKILQSSNIAARGVVQAYNTGSSGSTWLVDNSKIIDITENVDDSYKVMSKKTVLSEILS
ncbi:unnamed protein product [Danaus chrysippus]|uniref:(African queen) hypothetical protein n=1 Tax=Danaus chrysippus TaxID=151541 RepID=A0A8J2RCC9_9NEOP|nr:unnamed protein product [Danaus chrysippus]